MLRAFRSNRESHKNVILFTSNLKPGRRWSMIAVPVRASTQPLRVMAGLVPAIHVFPQVPPQDVDARDEPGHDNRKAAPL